MTSTQQTGEIALEIGGRVRTLAFTMGALLQFSGHYKGGISEGFELLTEGNMPAVVNLTTAALRTRKAENALPAGFDEDACSEWVAELAFFRQQQFQQLTAAIAQSLEGLGNRMASEQKTAAPTPAQA